MKCLGDFHTTRFRVLNFAHHLPKPWTDRFAHVNRISQETTATATKTSLKTEVNSQYSKLYRALSILFTLSNVGKCFWSWIVKDCIKVKEKKRKLLSYVPVLDKTWIYRIYSIKRPGRLLNFWTLRVGAYSRWALIRGWALIIISPFSASVVCLFCNKTINANNKTRRSNKARFL